jgi:hypothetical protein
VRLWDDDFQTYSSGRSTGQTVEAAAHRTVQKWLVEGTPKVKTDNQKVSQKRVMSTITKYLEDAGVLDSERKYETNGILELLYSHITNQQLFSEGGFIMCFMADQNIQQLNDERDTRYRGQYRNRLFKAETISDPIPDDADKEKVSKKLNFSDEESMEFFRTKKRNFPDILAKRVLYHLEKWYGDGTGIEGIQEHFDKCFSEKG